MYRRRGRRAVGGGSAGTRKDFDADAEIKRCRDRIKADAAASLERINGEITRCESRLSSLRSARDLQTVRVLRRRLDELRHERDEPDRRLREFESSIAGLRPSDSIAVSGTLNLDLQREAVVSSLCDREGRHAVTIQSNRCVSCHVSRVVHADRSCLVCPRCGDTRPIVSTVGEQVEVEIRIRNRSSKGKSRAAAAAMSGLDGVAHEWGRKRPADGPPTSSGGEGRRAKRSRTTASSAAKAATKTATQDGGGGSSEKAIAKRVDDYRLYLSQWSEDTKNPPADVIRRVQSNLNAVHILHEHRVRKPTTIEAILRDNDMVEYAWMSDRIRMILLRRTVSGMRHTIPTLSKATIERMVRRYEIVLRRTKNKKMMSMSYLSHQFLVQDNMRSVSTTFEVHRTRNVLNEKDRAYQAMCVDLEKDQVGGFSWVFYRSS
jgi:hypothetical protein